MARTMARRVQVYTPEYLASVAPSHHNPQTVCAPGCALPHSCNSARRRTLAASSLSFSVHGCKPAEPANPRRPSWALQAALQSLEKAFTERQPLKLHRHRCRCRHALLPLPPSPGPQTSELVGWYWHVGVRSLVALVTALLGLLGEGLPPGPSPAGYEPRASERVLAARLAFFATAGQAVGAAGGCHPGRNAGLSAVLHAAQARASFHAQTC